MCLAFAAVACDNDDDNNDYDQISDNDRQFVQQASMGNYAEIGAGTTASTTGSDSSIRAYGSMMVTDHTDAQNRLKAMASEFSLAAPDSLDATHLALKNQLDTLSGAAFDSVYIHSQVTDHANTITLFENQANGGSNSRLREYANSLLPTLRTHKQMADSLSMHH